MNEPVPDSDPSAVAAGRGDPTRVPFIIGVTGHTDLDPGCRPKVEAALECCVRWIRGARQTHDPVLGECLGLTETPLLLLTSLAPGADQWVARHAHAAGIDVMAPLPFLKEQYLRATTFQKDGATRDPDASEFLAGFPDAAHPRDSAFLVRLPDEVDLDDDTLRHNHEPLLAGPEHKRERDRRYAAAGEYVAAYCDLLLALTDKPIGEVETGLAMPGETPGARAIAELKRRGMTPEVLPIQPALSWADNGPVLHVFAPRKGSAAPSAATDRPDLEILYPYDCQPAGTAESDARNAAWLKAGHALLLHTAEHLEEFNVETSLRDEARESRELADMLPPGVRDLLAADAHAPEHCGRFKTGLARIARLRRRSANYNAHYDGRFNHQKRVLFGLAFAAATLFSLAENWEVEHEALRVLQAVFFGLALAVTVFTWGWYFRRVRRSATGSRCDDYRAVAEGLRVQFYWTACGNGESVASGYLQRQRGEMAWIRNVISAAAFPYEESRACFHRLSPASQLQVLASIRLKWLRGQLKYFEHDKVARLTLRQQVFALRSKVLLWTGFALTVFSYGTRFAHAPVLSRPWAAAALLVGGGGLAVAWRCGWLRGHAESEELAAGEEEGAPLFDWLGKPCLLIAAMTLCILGVAFLAGADAWWVPPARKLTSFLKDLSITIGLLCGAWMSVNFFAENIRRYRSMASLFKGADRRVGEHLDSIGRVPTERQDEARRQAVRHIQALLTAVGREALSENTEWLIAHRVRPLEPLSS